MFLFLPSRAYKVFPVVSTVCPRLSIFSYFFNSVPKYKHLVGDAYRYLVCESYKASNQKIGSVRQCQWHESPIRRGMLKVLTQNHFQADLNKPSKFLYLTTVFYSAIGK